MIDCIFLGLCEQGEQQLLTFLFAWNRKPMAVQFRHSLKQLDVAHQICIRTQWDQAGAESTNFVVNNFQTCALCVFVDLSDPTKSTLLVNQHADYFSVLCLNILEDNVEA